MVINENPTFPATKHFPAAFDFNDEFYQPSQFSRDKIDVLLRLNVKPGDARTPSRRRLSAGVGEDRTARAACSTGRSPIRAPPGTSATCSRCTSRRCCGPWASLTASPCPTRCGAAPMPSLVAGPAVGQHP